MVDQFMFTNRLLILFILVTTIVQNEIELWVCAGTLVCGLFQEPYSADCELDYYLSIVVTWHFKR